MIPGLEPIRQIQASFQIHPITAVLGPRQCGKTTLARYMSEQEPTTFFDLENPVDIQRLSAPVQTLKDLSGLVILDEVQRKPELFELFRVVADRSDLKARFLLLGSASPHLVKGVSESLARRIGFVDLAGFQLWEVGAEHRDRLWIRGGLPRAFLADTDSGSMQWRENFVRTFLERDIPQLGITIAAETLRRFWTMVAHSQGPEERKRIRGGFDSAEGRQQATAIHRGPENGRRSADPSIDLPRGPGHGAKKKQETWLASHRDFLRLFSGA
jgi:uncharacterized protein